MNYAEIFPAPIAAFVSEVSLATKAPADFVAASVLSAGAVIAAPITLKVRDGQYEWSNLYVGLVAQKGWAKSPAMKMALAPLCRLQTEEALAYEEQMEQHEKKLASVRGNRSRDAHEERAALESSAPMPNQHIVLTGGTMEGIVVSLYQNKKSRYAPHLLLHKDELRGFFGDMDAYRERGSDMEKYLSMYNGGDMTIRNVGRQFTLQGARLSILGSIQPEIFKSALDEKMHENGLFDRFMFFTQDGFPPPSDLCVSPCVKTISDYEMHMISAFIGYNRPEGGEGAPSAEMAYTTAQRDRLNAVCAEYHRIGGRHNTGAFKKWETNLFKLSIVLSALHKRARMDDDVLDLAIKYARHMVDQWLKSNRLHNQSDEEEIRRRILEWVEGAGDAGVAVSEITRKKYFRNRAPATTEAITSLVKDSLVREMIVQRHNYPAKILFQVQK